MLLLCLLNRVPLVPRTHRDETHAIDVGELIVKVAIVVEM